MRPRSRESTLPLPTAFKSVPLWAAWAHCFRVVLPLLAARDRNCERGEVERLIDRARTAGHHFSSNVASFTAKVLGLTRVSRLCPPGRSEPGRLQRLPQTTLMKPVVTVIVLPTAGVASACFGSRPDESVKILPPLWATARQFDSPFPTGVTGFCGIIHQSLLLRGRADAYSLRAWRMND